MSEITITVHNDALDDAAQAWILAHTAADRPSATKVTLEAYWAARMDDVRRSYRQQYLDDLGRSAHQRAIQLAHQDALVEFVTAMQIPEPQHPTPKPPEPPAPPPVHREIKASAPEPKHKAAPDKPRRRQHLWPASWSWRLWPVGVVGIAAALEYFLR